MAEADDIVPLLEAEGYRIGARPGKIGRQHGGIPSPNLTCRAVTPNITSHSEPVANRCPLVLGDSPEDGLSTGPDLIGAQVNNVRSRAA